MKIHRKAGSFKRFKQCRLEVDQSYEDAALSSLSNQLMSSTENELLTDLVTYNNNNNKAGSRRQLFIPAVVHADSAS